MNEINEIARLISENVDQSARIIFGAYHDRKLNKGQLKVTLIATGFNGSFNHKSDSLLPSLFGQKTILENKLETNRTEEETKKNLWDKGLALKNRKKGVKWTLLKIKFRKKSGIYRHF